MFDPKKPYNDLPKLKDIHIDIHGEILSLAIEANKEIGKLDGLAILLPNYEVLIHPLLAKESVASNAIENINTTTLEFLQKEAIGKESLLGAEKEVLYYRNTILKGIELMQKWGGISTNMLIDLQRQIEPKKSGIRKIPGTVIANGAGEILYTPPVGEDIIKELLTDLEKRINTTDTTDPLIKMPIIHLQFESIHPFQDGNGRIGRILMMLYLILTNKLQKPVLFLSSYILENRQQYYESLRRGNETNNFTDIIIFILKGVIQESKKTQEKIIAINQCLEQTIKQLQHIGIKDSYNMAMAFFKSPFISINNIAEDLGITRQSASTYIKKGEEAGIIQTIKIGVHKLSYLPAYIDLIK